MAGDPVYYDTRGGKHRTESSAQAANALHAERLEEIQRLGALAAARGAEEAAATRRAVENQERHAAATHKAVLDKIQFDVDVAFLSVSSTRERIEYYLREASRSGALFAAAFGNGAPAEVAALRRQREEAEAQAQLAGGETYLLKEEVAKLSEALAKSQSLLSENTEVLRDALREQGHGTFSFGWFLFALSVLLLGLVWTCEGIVNAKSSKLIAGVAGIVVGVSVRLALGQVSKAMLRPKVEALRAECREKVAGLPLQIEQLRLRLAQSENRANTAAARASELRDHADALLISHPDTPHMLELETVAHVTKFLNGYPPNCRSTSEEIRDAAKSIMPELIELATKHLRGASPTRVSRTHSGVKSG